VQDWYIPLILISAPLCGDYHTGTTVRHDDVRDHHFKLKPDTAVPCGLAAPPSDGSGRYAHGIHPTARTLLPRKIEWPVIDPGGIYTVTNFTLGKTNGIFRLFLIKEKVFGFGSMPKPSKLKMVL
jgi:hypothetical protein